MSSGAELPLLFALGFVLLGPKRMRETLRQVARLRAEFQKATRGIESQLSVDQATTPGMQEHTRQDML